MLSNISGRKEKRWVSRDEITPSAVSAQTAISAALNLNPVLAKLLYNRGYQTPDAAGSFLRLENEILGDPFILNDMKEAVARILEAVRSGEKITIYGDYDVDGVTSVCTLLLYLRSLGAEVGYYIPNRSGEGYGVSTAAIDRLRGEGTTLLITVDTGITANEEIAHAREIGMDVVVTDHHECQDDLPVCCAVVNPHRPDCTYPFRELAGVGVVFKLLCAIEETVSGESRQVCVMSVCSQYADLIAIGTIADVMPIRDENKLIVKFGLRMIGETKRPGLRALLDAVSRPADSRVQQKKNAQKITSGYIGYTIAPRINAVGRIRSASIAVELFLSEDPQRAEELARELCEANRDRQTQENKIMQEAYLQIEERHDFEHDPVIVLESDEWHHGVIGIVSSRVTERFGLPSILISFEGCDSVPSPDDIGKGSGRSIKGLNLVEALMHCSDCLTRFGGHELAAGLSVRRGDFETFRREINDYARKHLTEEDVIPSISYDCELRGTEVTMELAQDLQYMEPYGVGNPVPVFLLRSLLVSEIVPVSGGKHTRILFSDGARGLQAMCFGFPSSSIGVFIGDRADILFTLDINEWGGKRNLQLVVKDIRPSGESVAVRSEERERFDAVFSGAPFTQDEDILPSREDFTAVYLLLRHSFRAGVDCLTHRVIQSRLYGTYNGKINYIKLKMIIRILEEMNILGIDEISEETYRFTIRFSDTKTDLEKSNLLRRLRSQITGNR